MIDDLGFGVLRKYYQNEKKKLTITVLPPCRVPRRGDDLGARVGARHPGRLGVLDLRGHRRGRRARPRRTGQAGGSPVLVRVGVDLMAARVAAVLVRPLLLLRPRSAVHAQQFHRVRHVPFLEEKENGTKC